jgi:PAS domain S-box-containing protein/putative nucleotidyltransferase with HDIG domain
VVSSFRDITERKQARQALQKSEIRYGELFNKMLDGVAIHEMVYDERGEAVDYRFLKVNPAFEKNTGLQAEAIIGKTICEVMPETEDVWINTYANVVSSGEAARFEKHSKVLDKYYEVVAFASGDKRFATIFQDITDRRESERLLMRTNRALRTLSRCNEILVHTSNEQRLLNDICHAIVELGKFQLVWVGLAEEDKDKSIRIATRCGQATAFLDDVAISWAGPDADPGPTGNAIRSGEAQVERYISRADDPVPWRRVAVEHGLASFIALPMHIGDTVLGAVNIYSGREDAFDSEEANLLMDLAQDLAYGIASQRARVAHAGAIQAVKRNEHNLHSIINHEADGIMVLDADDTILFTNPALEKVLGRESKKFIGTQFGFPIADDDSSEIELINQNGELIQCEMRVTDVEWQNKPARLVSIHDISERIRLEQEREENLKRQQEMLVETITAMSNAVETRDPYTAGHMHRVSDLSIVIAEQMGLDSDQIEGIRLGGIIHDIGKLSVPAEILNRPGRLTPAEFEIIKSHSQVGYDIIKGVSFRWPVAEMVYQHHERIDGSGYPNGLKGNEIVLEARILAVADVVEAMSSHRPYRASLGLEPALEEIRKNAGKIYDQEVVDACLQVIETGQFTIE